MTAATFGKRGISSNPSGVVSPSRNSVQQPKPQAVASSLSEASRLTELPDDMTEIPPHWVNLSFSRLLFSAMFCSAMLAFGLYLQMPYLMRDAHLAQTYELDLSVKVNHGDCTGFTILHFCEVSFTTENNGITQTENTHFFVTALDIDKQLLMPVRSTADASAISVDYAVNEALPNRIWSMIIWGLLGVALILNLVFLLVMGRYQGGPADRWT